MQYLDHPYFSTRILIFGLQDGYLQLFEVPFTWRDNKAVQTWKWTSRDWMYAMTTLTHAFCVQSSISAHILKYIDVSL